MQKNRLLMVMVVLLLIQACMPLFSSCMADGEEIKGEKNVESTQGKAPWACFGHDRRRTGRSSVDSSHVDGEVKWKYDAGNFVYSSPAVSSDGDIYVGCWDHKLYSLDQNGSLRWTYATEGDIDSSPALAGDGTIYFGSGDSKLYAVRPDGSKKWTFSTGSSIFSSPVVDENGTVYIGSTDGKLYSLTQDGTLRWSYEVEGSILSSPSVQPGGDVIFASGIGVVYSINRVGQMVWNYTTGGEITSSPAVSEDGTIYIGSKDGGLYALNSTGGLEWRFNTSGQVTSSPALASDGTIYLGSHDNKLYAVNPDGTKRWTFSAGGEIHSSPAVGGNGRIYFGCNDGKVYGLKPEGQKMWSYQTMNRVPSSPAIGMDGTIYIGSGDSQIYAFTGMKISPPTSPRNLEADPYDQRVLLDWDTPLNDGGAPILHYKVYQGETPDSKILIDRVNYSDYEVKNLTNGKTYYFQVSAVNDVGEGNRSDEVNVTPEKKTEPPGVPVNITIEAGDGFVNLSWEPPTEDGGAPLRIYRVYRGTGPGNKSLQEETDSTSYHDDSVKNGRTYHYQVSAVNEVGEGQRSKDVYATPEKSITIEKPGAPSVPGAKREDGNVLVSWYPPSELGNGTITGYKVYKGESPSDMELLAKIDDTKYVDDNVSRGKTYYYRVSAVNEAGEGESTQTLEVSIPKEEDTPSFTFLPFLGMIILVAAVKESIKREEGM